MEGNGSGEQDKKWKARQLYALAIVLTVMQTKTPVHVPWLSRSTVVPYSLKIRLL